MAPRTASSSPFAHVPIWQEVPDAGVQEVQEVQEPRPTAEGLAQVMFTLRRPVPGAPAWPHGPELTQAPG